MKADTPTPRSQRRAVLLWARLASAYHHSLRDAEARLESHPVSLIEFDILTHVGSSPDCTQVELSARLLVTQGNITYHIHKLERAALLERHNDGRCKRLRLTTTGREVTQRAASAQAAAHLERFSLLEAGEQQQLLVLLKKLG